MKLKDEIILTEYQSVSLKQDSIPLELGEYIWKNYSSQVMIDFPSPKTNWQWILINQGWAGYIPVSNELLLVLKPKVPIENIFRMLEYAFNLRSFYFLQDQVQCESLRDFFNILVGILARRILVRARKGFYKTYKDKNERLPYICGRIDINQQIRAPINPSVSCHYQEYTADIADNQILLWTLYVIICSGLCFEKNLLLARRAYRSLQRIVQFHPFTAQSCLNRSYNRLNIDYQPIHNLCWFFLEHCGPKLAAGKQPMIPFMVSMPHLYQLFVAEWLKAHLPNKLVLKQQEKINVGKDSMIYFIVDLVIYDKETKEALCVLDTKYKLTESISTNDFSQVVTYALAKDCLEALLIYPGKLSNESNSLIQNIRVTSLSFFIDGDIEMEGDNFLNKLLWVVGYK